MPCHSTEWSISSLDTASTLLAACLLFCQSICHSIIISVSFSVCHSSYLCLSFYLSHLSVILLILVVSVCHPTVCSVPTIEDVFCSEAGGGRLVLHAVHSSGAGESMWQ